jgi:hypothetical protein
VHDGAQRRRGTGIADGFQFPVPAVRSKASSNAET